MVSVRQILPSFSPDIVLFDNTLITRFYGREHFYAYFASQKKKVVLLPHAPHHGYLTAFTPFDDVGDELPDYCEFWMPFKYARSWEKLPDKKSQFSYVGYPGMDSKWLDNFKLGTQPCLTGEPKPSPSRHALTCLFIIRRFLPKEQAGRPGPDAYIYSYDEFLYYIKLVETAFKNTGIDIELIVKPHPSSDYETLRHVFAESGIANWRISYEPVYALLAVCDFTISLYSTVPLITAMAGIPTVLLNSSTQDMVHQEDIMKQLYTGLHFYLENPEDLPNRLKEVIDIASERKSTGGTVCTEDVEHLRQFYPDGAMQRCLDRLGI